MNRHHFAIQSLNRECAVSLKCMYVYVCTGLQGDLNCLSQSVKTLVKQF